MLGKTKPAEVGEQQQPAASGQAGEGFRAVRGVCAVGGGCWVVRTVSLSAKFDKHAFSAQIY